MSWGLESGSGVGAWICVLVLAAAFARHALQSPTGPGLAVLRGLAVLALALALLRPALLARESRLTKPRLLILLDVGHSMKSSAPGGGTRLETASAWLTRWRAAIEARAEPTVVLLSDRARPLGGLDALALAAAENTGFKPAQSLPDAVPVSGPPARVWLISDGVAEGGGDLGRALATLGAPVDMLGAGPSRRETGAAFLDLKAPDFAFLHGTIAVEASVEATGLVGRDVAVTLSRADDAGSGGPTLGPGGPSLGPGGPSLGPGGPTFGPGGWREVSRLRRRVNADLEVFPVRLTAPADQLGTARLRLTTAGGGNSRSREFRVETVRQKYRIMYLAGRPSAEYSALREFLKADPNHELVSFVILRNPENPSPASDPELSLIPFPADQIFGPALPQFDLFVLENFSAARFRLPPQYLDALKRFVYGGGALLVKGGENAFSAGGYKGSALEEVLPVVLSGRSPDFISGLFSPQPGPRDHPLVRLYETPEASRRAWDALPPLDGWGRFASVRPGTTVLATHPYQTAEDGTPLPIAAVRSYGRGKVMLISTDSSWRWKLGAAADPDAAGFYARFWTRAVQYLTGSLDLSKVKFAPLPDRILPREPARLSLRVFDESFGPALSADTRLTVIWTGSDGRAREVVARESEPGVYAVELTGLSPGPQRVRAAARVRGRPWGEDEVRFSWESAVEEPMDRAWLTKAAVLGGGRFFVLTTVRPDELLSLLPLPSPRDETVRRMRPFASPFWLALAGVLFLLEWVLRRRAGHA